MAIKRPLDSRAVGAADDRFYEKYPEMIDENGNRIPLSATDDPNNEMHEDWVKFYNEELGNGDDSGDDEDETDEGESGIPPDPGEDDDPFPTTPPDPCQSCPKSWISLDLNYLDKADCIGVKYSALTTEAYEQPTTTAAPKRWDDITAGNCLFGEFDFHSKGTSATKPAF